MKISSIRVRLPISYALIALLTTGVLGGILLLSLQNFYKLLNVSEEKVHDGNDVTVGQCLGA